MTTYFVYFIQCEYTRAIKKFESKQEALRYAKEQVESTDGSFAIQIIGFDDQRPVYTKTYRAINYKPKVLR